MTLIELLNLRFRPMYEGANEGGGGPAGGTGDDNAATSLLSGGGEDSTPAGDDTLEGGDDTLPDGDDTLEGGGEDTPPADDGKDEFVPLAADDIALPEGLEVNEETMTEFLGVINDQELSRAELAQKLVDLQISAGERGQEAATVAAQALWDETQSTWQTEARALPDIGGDNLDKSLADIKKGLEAAGATKETFNALDVTGAGNHPEVIKLFHALTKNLVEPSPVSGNPPAGKLSRADQLFGNSE